MFVSYLSVTAIVAMNLSIFKFFVCVTFTWRNKLNTCMFLFYMLYFISFFASTYQCYTFFSLLRVLFVLFCFYKTMKVHCFETF